MPASSIIVYLDTQDYNNLSSGRAEFENVLRYIEDSVNEGSVSIGYSYPLLFELLRNYDQKHKPQRLRIARFVKALCRERAFPHPIDINKGAKFPNNGVWLPLAAVRKFEPKAISQYLFSSFKRSIHNEGRLTRIQKRALSTKSGLRELLRHLPDRALTKADFEGIPISDDFLANNYLQSFMRGEITDVQLSKHMTKWLNDPEYTMQLWYEYAGKANPLESIVDNAYEKIDISLSKLRELSEEISTQRKKAKAAQSRLHQILHEGGIPAELRKTIKIPPLPPLFTLQEIDVDPHRVLGRLRTIQFNCYVQALMRGQIAPLKSDLGDLLHLIYLPDVDLLRCDKRMASVMKTCNEIEHRKLVPALGELPQRIEELKYSRASN